jgi:integrase
VRLVRNVKLDGEPIFAAPDITPKGVISSEMVRYKGQKLKIPAAEGNWYIRWEEGSKPKWQRAASMTEAIGLRVRKQYELQALSAGIEIKADDPSRLRLADALQQYVDDQKLLKRSKKTLAVYRTTKETFLKSCHRAYLDQVDRRDLLRYAESLRKDGLSDRTVFTRWTALMTMLKFHGIRGLAKRGDAPQYVEGEPESYRQEELEALFKACKPEYHLLFSFYLKTGFRMQEVMYLHYSDLNFDHQTVSVRAKPDYGFIPKRWMERTIPLEKGLTRSLEARRKGVKSNGLVFPTKNGKPNTKHLLALKRIAKRAGLDKDTCWLHKFRATFATEHLRNAIDVRTVQMLLGHKDLQSTMRYLQPARGQAIQAKFNATFAGF